MKTLLFLLIFSHSLMAQTQMGGLIEDANQRFHNKSSAPIIVFDRDEIGWLFAQAKAYDNEPLQAQIIVEYVRERFDIEIEYKDGINLAVFLAKLTSNATALPIIDYTADEIQKKFCAVFPPSANSNQRIAHEKITGLFNKEIVKDFSYDFLKRRMSYDKLEKYSLYHEVSHCLDDKFILGAYKYGAGPRKVHQGEGFAETLALFLMAGDNHFGIAKTRANQRAIYSKLMGPYFAHNPALGMGDPNFTNGGVIYYLTPMLMNARKWVLPMRFSSLEKKIARAIKVVESSSIQARSFTAIYRSMRDGREAMIAEYKESALDWPEMFEQTYHDLLDYISNVDKIVKRSFGSKKIKNKFKSEPLIPFSLPELCSRFNNRDKQGFFTLIDSYRSNLKRVISGASERAILLDGIYEKVSNICL